MKRVVLFVMLSLSTAFAQYHTDFKTVNVHVPYRWIWSDSAARVGTSTIKRDTLKLGLQRNNMTVWMCVDSPAVWKFIGGQNRSYVDSILNGVFIDTATSRRVIADSVIGSVRGNVKGRLFGRADTASIADNVASSGHNTMGTLSVSGACTTATLNTGNGNYELWAMDQNVRTTDDPTFDSLTLGKVNTGKGWTEVALLDTGLFLCSLQVKESHDPYTPVDTVVDTVFYQKHGPVVTLHFSNFSTTELGDVYCEFLAGAIPSALRPAAQTRVPIVVSNGVFGQPYSAIALLNTTGSITFVTDAAIYQTVKAQTITYYLR